MKLYVTMTSPYARLARIVVHEKGLAGRVEIVAARTRAPGSPYYAVNPSGRVPYLVTGDGVGLEDSQVVCAYLDGLDASPRFHPASDPDWSHRRLEAYGRSLLDGIAVWAREKPRPESERSPTTLAHEGARAPRIADFFEAQVTASSDAGPAQHGAAGARRGGGHRTPARHGRPHRGPAEALGMGGPHVGAALDAGHGAAEVDSGYSAASIIAGSTFAAQNRSEAEPRTA